jgi:hypothetical protein
MRGFDRISDRERLQIGSQLLFSVAPLMLGIIVYGLYGLLFVIKDFYWLDLLSFNPTFAIVGTLFIGIYVIGIATVGAVIGGYLVRDGV